MAITARSPRSSWWCSCRQRQRRLLLRCSSGCGACSSLAAAVVVVLGTLLAQAPLADALRDSKPLPASASQPAAAAAAAAQGAAAAAAAHQYGLQPNPIGYHEGARRTLTCADNGYVVGLDAYLTPLGGFEQLTVNALRVVCSSGRVQLEYEPGVLPDSLVYGNLEVQAQPTRVMCPAGSGIAAIEWRRVPGLEKDTTARIAGMRVHCGTESSSEPFIIDSLKGQEYPAALKCSLTKGAPAGPRFRLTAVELWHEQLLTGLHLISCESAAS